MLRKAKNNRRKKAAAEKTKQQTPAKTVTQSDIEGMIKEANKPVLSRSTLAFIEAVTNPFGNGLHLGPKTMSAVIPDGDNRRSIALTLTGEITFLGSTSHNGLICLRYPSIDAQEIGTILSGADSSVPTDVPTLATQSVCVESALTSAFVKAGVRYRLVGGAVKVRSASADDKTAGVLHAYLTSSAPKTGVAYSTWTASPIPEETRLLNGDNSGMTVRTPHVRQDCVYAASPATDTAAYNHTQGLPMIRFTDISDTTVLQINYVMHIEVEVAGMVLPFATAESTVDSGYEAALGIISNKELVVSGNSFKSFLRSVGKGVRTGFKIASTVADVAQVASSIL